MPDETQDIQQQSAPPPVSYQKLGLGAKFVMEFKKRMDAAAKASKLAKVRDLHTDMIKKYFVEALLQVPADPADEEDFKSLVKVLPDMGAMCSVIGYKVGIIPGKRSAIDATRLRLKLTDYNLTMEEIDTIVKDSTIESTWGEFSAELLNPNGGKKKVKKKAAPAKRKPAPISTTAQNIKAAAKKIAAQPTPAPTKPKAKAPARLKKG